MTTVAIRSPAFRKSFHALLAAITIAATAFLAGPAANAQILGNEPSRLVTIQGGGLQFLDAFAMDRYNLGPQAVTNAFNGGQSQQWLIASGGNGTYTIQQRSSGMFLDAHEVAAEDYAVVLRPRQTADSTQLWRIVEYGGGFVTFQQVSSGRFLEATVDAGRGFRVVTRPQGSQMQEWRLGSP